MSAATLVVPIAVSRFSEVNMSSGGLDEPAAKLGRAIEHYRVIKRDFFAGYDRQARPATLERQRDGLEYRVRVGEIEPLPADLPLMLGDAYFNLRAALDYLVYQMHVRHFRGDQRIPLAVAERSAFPIRDRKPALATEKWAQIAKPQSTAQL